ncbi:hypothetical protein [Metabacillus idriensis]|uniref:hypothetical protein n=1 Tax=Metabacillus idriensis TaxID=324768 RepID=UPI0017490907|nr:hypothetical protein [Metabacillus idriensis]
MSGSELLEIVNYSDLQTSMKVDEYDLKSVKVDKEVNVIISYIGFPFFDEGDSTVYLLFCYLGLEL